MRTKVDSPIVSSPFNMILTVATVVIVIKYLLQSTMYVSGITYFCMLMMNAEYINMCRVMIAMKRPKIKPCVEKLRIIANVLL